MRAFSLDPSLIPIAARSSPAHHAAHRLVSRRAFMGGAAGLTATALGASVFRAPAAWAKSASLAVPKPTTSVVSLGGQDFHLSFFGQGMDPSSITDFNGFVGVADVQGTGTATNADGSTDTLLFDTDMRFMDGQFVGVDGKVHQAVFGFV
jgi:hypothetical protein